MKQFTTIIDELSKSDRVALLIAYSTLWNEWPTDAQLSELLGRYRRLDAALSVAWLLTVTRAWARTTDTTIDRQLREYVLPDYAAQFKQYEDRFVFSRPTLLWLLKRVFVICPHEGTALRTREDLQKLGEACLIANDLAVYRERRTLRTDMDIAANFMPFSELFSHQEYNRDIVRTRLMLADIVRGSGNPHLQHLPEDVERLLGLSISDYTDVALATAMKSVAVDISNFETFVQPGMRSENFTTTSIPVSRAESFLRENSATEDQFYIAARDKTSLRFDLTMFREFPLLHLEDGSYAVLDAGFTLDKAGRGIIWTAVKRETKSQKRILLLGRWGELFEAYVAFLLKEVPHRERTVLSDLRFSDGTQAVDCCVLEARTLAGIEVKASTLPSFVRYADNAQMLQEEIEKRYVLGDESGRKGLSQLSRFIKRFSSGEAIFEAATGIAISPSKVSKVIPVLIHLDNALRTVRMNHYLATRLKELGRVRRHVVTPLALIAVSELEELQGHLSEYLLTDLLESYLSRLWKDRTTVFYAAAIPMLANAKVVNGPMLSRLEVMLREMAARLFPKPASTAD